MKLFLIAALSFCSFNIYAVEFYRCVDDKGHPHFTNLAAGSLDNNCRPKTDHYAYMFKQDHSSVETQFKLYSESETLLDESTDSATASDNDQNMLDADNALD